MNYYDVLPRKYHKYITVEHGGMYRVPDHIDKIFKKLEQKILEKESKEWFDGGGTERLAEAHDGLSYDVYEKDPSLLSKWLNGGGKI